MPRLHVDWTRCDGHGLCAELLPELLGRDDWGFPVPLYGEREPVAPAHLEEHARHAVASCPLLALTLVPDRRPVKSGESRRGTWAESFGSAVRRRG